MSELATTRASWRRRAAIAVAIGMLGVGVGAYSTYLLMSSGRREVIAPLSPPSPRSDQVRIKGPRWVEPDGSKDQLCFDRVLPAAFEIANGDRKSGAAALDAYIEFLARRQRSGTNERYRQIPYVIEREVGESDSRFVVRPRTGADDIGPALQAAASIAAHMESMGYTSIRRFPCTVRVESEDIPSFFTKFPKALKELGLTAKEGNTEEVNAYWYGFEIHEASIDARKGLFFAEISGNESSLDVIYFDLDHPFDWRGEEEWLMRLLSKMSGTATVLRVDWIDPHVVVVGGRSSGGPCGSGEAMPADSKGK